MLGNQHDTSVKLCSNSSIFQFGETEIKKDRDTLHKLVITDSEQPEFMKRIIHKTGDSKNVKWMNEIYKICQEYPQ